jgi:hypothetical protein
MRAGKTAASVRTGEATTVKSPTTLRNRTTAEPGEHHRDRSETLHE